MNDLNFKKAKSLEAVHTHIHTGSLKTNKGITLIALVITVIVLIILAGIAISMLSGDNGILKQATNAKEQTENQSEIEQIKLAVTAAMINPNHKIESEEEFQRALDNQFGKENAIASPVKGGYSVIKDEVEYRVTSSGDILEVTNIDSAKTSTSINRVVKDANNEEFVIPANFNIATDEYGNVIEDEITKGIVIEDSEDNQYVWIPIFEFDEANCTWGVDYSEVENEDDWEGIEIALKNYTKTYKINSYQDVWYGDENFGQYGYYDGEKFNYYTNGNMTETEYNNLYHNMLKSVYTNGGFYIGRYEMGIEVVDSVEKAQSITRIGMSEYTATSTNAKNTAPTIEGMSKPISKANAVPYNYITQSQAQMLAESLNYSSVTSSLMFGVQWDAVCVFIEKYDKNNTAITRKSDWLKSNGYSRLWGNYRNSIFKMNRGFYRNYSSDSVIWNAATEKGVEAKWLCTTGASDQNRSLNIYDFSGNFNEFTLEKAIESGWGIGTYRGGYYFDLYAAATRFGINTYENNLNLSARISLFI